MPHDKAHGLASLLADYPELGAGLNEFVHEDGDAATAMVGIYTLLKLRLRAVVSLLPGPAADEEDAFGPAGK